MNIKMGFLGAHGARNYDATMQSLKDPALRARLGLGKFLINSTAGATKGLDSAANALTSSMLSPGGPVSRAGGSALSGAYSALEKAPSIPGASALMGIAAPVVLMSQVQDAQRMRPMFNDAIQEGRQVYANDQEFLEKKAAASQKTAATFQMPTLRGFPGADQPGYPRFNIGLMPKPTNFSEGVGNAGGNAMSSVTQGLGSIMGGGFGPGLGQVAGGGLASLFKGLGDTIGAGGKASIDPFAGSMGYRFNRMMNPVTTRIKADELMAQNFLGTFASEGAKSIVGLLKDVALNAFSAMKQAPAHKSMVDIMQASDPILARAAPEQLTAAYQTMAKFAPTLATDENAVRSFLREAVVSGSGVDYATISNIAKTEAAIRGD